MRDRVYHSKNSYTPNTYELVRTHRESTVNGYQNAHSKSNIRNIRRLLETKKIIIYAITAKSKEKK